MLVQIARLLATLDLDDVLWQTIDLTTRTVGAARGTFFLLDEQGETLQRFISAQEYDAETRQIVSRRVLEQGLAGWVMFHGQSALIEDTLTDARWVVLDAEKERERVRSALCVPFFVEGELRGVITLEHPQPNHFTQAHLRLVEAAANQAAASLRNAQLFDRVQGQQRQLQAVLDSVSESLLVLDTLLCVRLANPAALTLIGAQLPDVLGFNLESLAERLGNPFLAQLAQKLTVALQENTNRFEARDERAKRDFVVNVARIDARRAAESGYVVALSDVSSLKDLTRLKTHMIQMASHDLKNPIGVLRNYLDVIYTDVQSGTMPDLLFLENMRKVLERMESLVVNLLNIQRAEEAEPLRREEFNPNDLIAVALEDMLPVFHARQQQLTQNIQPNLRPLKGDFERLREVIKNLLDNASKYTPEGGSIVISAYSEEERFTFSVKDNGYGIPADQQASIFQPYFRAKQAATQHISGTGVGLSLVKEVVERHGGQVWFISKEGQGSTFGFWLPILN
ncbi:MAG: ATP-binding protein [Anaerolineae bacterium]|nr:ATP-binding protein [Anaerolineae bacterium]